MDQPCRECERLNLIEAGLHAGPPALDDVHWMIFQIRGWQQFAKRVIDFDDVLRTEGASPAVRAGYERLFTPHANQPG